jgi:dTDP-L-rhamnose 4-epimerase
MSPRTFSLSYGLWRKIDFTGKTGAASRLADSEQSTRQSRSPFGRRPAKADDRHPILTLGLGTWASILSFKRGNGLNVLITGGAGFIGSRLARKLSDGGAQVTIVDNLSEQVHGPDAVFDRDLTPVATCVRGDVRDRAIMAELFADTEVVVHLAAETGTGQSMYAVEHYADVNVQGTAVLLDLLVNARPAALRKIIVASSRAVYGEGQYRCAAHGIVFPGARTEAAMSKGQFDAVCPQCHKVASVMATTEATPYGPSSFYGLTKQVQEQMVLMFAAALGIDGFGLRYQNVYGPGQSLTNPYTGILAVFSNLVRQGKPLNIFEDGEESRDFVFVDDVVEATAACIRPDVHGVMALNVGSGHRTTVMEVAQAVIAHFGADVPIAISGAYRVGDIRHNVADISAIRDLTGYDPKWNFTDGLKSFLDWASGHEASDAGFDKSLKELSDRQLLRGSQSA